MKTVGNKKVMVYENLKRRIIDCELIPGMPINEADFASELGVSKTPVREALRQLERDGFVDNVPGRGSTISHITPMDIREILEIREIIETGAAKLAARLHSHDGMLRAKKPSTKNCCARKQTARNMCTSGASGRMSIYPSCKPWATRRCSICMKVC